jgi:hypothetical protein
MTSRFVISLNTFLARWFPVDYETYIRSAAWKRKADAAKERAMWRCQGCGRPQGIISLSAHHSVYARLGYEIPEDLTVLCQEACHPAITQVRRTVFNRRAQMKA